jgi:hypothetical protein
MAIIYLLQMWWWSSIIISLPTSLSPRSPTTRPTTRKLDTSPCASMSPKILILQWSSVVSNNHSRAVQNNFTIGLCASSICIKDLTTFSSTWNGLIEDETTLILLEISCSVSKRYNYAYSGRASWCGSKEPILLQTWPLILKTYGPWPSFMESITFAPIEGIANIELYCCIWSKKWCDSGIDYDVKKPKRGCGDLHNVAVRFCLLCNTNCI